MVVSASSEYPRLTSLSHGGGCGCKIAPGVLSNLLSQLPESQPYANLLVGNETSDDAAVYKLNNSQALIATTDFFMPVVDDPYHFGLIAATNALSDIYAMGGTPIMALALVGMPINVLPHSVIAKVLEGGAHACSQAGIPVAGGHSIDSVEPIYGLAAMGLAHPNNIKRNNMAQEGDVLVLGKALGVGVMSAALKKNMLDEQGYKAMIASTTQLNKPGATLGANNNVHAITDVTGFGLLGHVLEIARASGLQANIDFSDLPWLPEVPELAKQGFITGASGRNWESFGKHIKLDSELTAFARDLLCDPQTSGGLLVACSPESVSQVLNVFHEQGMQSARVIGNLSSRDNSYFVNVNA